jgi:hypothetical protein
MHPARPVNENDDPSGQPLYHPYDWSAEGSKLSLAGPVPQNLHSVRSPAAQAGRKKKTAVALLPQRVADRVRGE